MSAPAPCWVLRDLVSGEDVHSDVDTPHYADVRAADRARADQRGALVPVQLDRPCVESVVCARCFDKPDDDVDHYPDQGAADQEAIGAGWTYTADGWLCAYEALDDLNPAPLPPAAGPGQEVLW